MKKVVHSLLATISPSHPSHSAGRHVSAIVIQLVVSTFCAVGAALILAPVIFFGIALFSMMFAGASLFEGLGSAWNNTLAYSILTGGLFGGAFFLCPYVIQLISGDELDANKDSYEQLKESQGFVGVNEFSGDNFIIMADEGMTKAMVFWGGKYSDSHDYTILTSENLIESTVYIDEMAVSKVKSGALGSVAGAAVGGVLTGGVGAIVGAIAGKRSTSESEVRVHKIGIHLTLKDATRPHAELVFRKPFSREDKGLMKGDIVFNHLVENANHWQAVLKNIAVGSGEPQPLYR